MRMEYDDSVYTRSGERKREERGSVTAIDDDAADSISIPVAARRYIAPPLPSPGSMNHVNVVPRSVEISCDRQPALSVEPIVSAVLRNVREEDRSRVAPPTLRFRGLADSDGRSRVF